MKIKSIVIGLGKIGMGYDYYNFKRRTNKILTHASAIDAHSNFFLSGGVDNNSLKKKDFYKKYKVDAYSSYMDAIKKVKPKLVIISTPIHTHYQILKKIINIKSIKIILCEKPITESIVNTNRIYKLLKKKKKFFLINYIRQYDPVINRVLKNLKKNQSNFPTQINAKYHNGFYNNASHILFLVSKIFGFNGKIKIISVKKKNPVISSNVNFEIEYKKGVAKFFSQNKKIRNEIEIMTPKRKINFSFRSGKIFFYNKKKKIKTLSTKMNISQYNVLNNINNYLKKKDKILCSNKDALKVEILLNKILQKI